MSDFDAYEGEMGHLSSLSDQELDRLLAGKEPSEEGALDELVAFLREAAAVLPEPPDWAAADRHIAAMVATARQLSESDSRDAKPSVNPSRADRKAPRFRMRSKPVFRNPLSGLAGKLALAAIVVLAAFGGTAYAGALPDGVQGAVADVADSIGVSLPGADNESDDGAVNDVDGGTLDDSDDDTVGNGDAGAVSDVNDGEVDEDDQGIADEDDQGNADEGDQGNADEGDQGNADEGDQGTAGEDSDSQGGDDQGGSQGGDDQGGGDEGDGDN